MNDENKRSSGIDVFGLMFIIFLSLKLGEFGQVANWSWWWVTSPLWAGFTFNLILFVISVLLQKRINNRFRIKSQHIIKPVNNKLPSPEEIKKHKKKKAPLIKKIKRWLGIM